MAYDAGWGRSYYDPSFNGSTSSSFNSWQIPNGGATQNEQYNPAFPSFNGTAAPYSAQNSWLSYQPTTTAPKKAAGKFPKKSGNRNNRGGGVQQITTEGFSNLVLIKKDLSSPSTPAVITKPAPSVDLKPPVNRNQVIGVGKSPNINGVKVAKVKKVGGGGGNFKKSTPKMPNYTGLQQQNGWGTNWRGPSNNRGGNRGGGRGGYRGFRRGPPRPQNNKDDIPFVSMDDASEAISLTCSSENIVAFHGFDSVFTLQHSFPVLIDGRIYTSCEHYYQIRKVTDLTGACSDKLMATVRSEDGKLLTTVKAEGGAKMEKRAYSAAAKELLKAANIEKSKIDEWRNTTGLDVIQKALLAKVTQSAHLREAMKETGSSILVHAYAGDSIYGTGCTVPRIKTWLDEMAKTGVKQLKVPAKFPLTEETVKTCPVFAQGRNILGVVLMQLREKVVKNEIQIMDMSRIFNVLRVNGQTEPMEVTESTTNGFKIGEAIMKGTF